MESIIDKILEEEEFRSIDPKSKKILEIVLRSIYNDYKLEDEIKSRQYSILLFCGLRAYEGIQCGNTSILGLMQFCNRKLLQNKNNLAEYKWIPEELKRVNRISECIFKLSLESDGSRHLDLIDIGIDKIESIKETLNNLEYEFRDKNEIMYLYMVELQECVLDRMYIANRSRYMSERMFIWNKTKKKNGCLIRFEDEVELLTRIYNPIEVLEILVNRLG